MHTYIRSVLSFHAQWTDTPQAQALNQSTAVHLLHCTKQHRSDSKLITVQTATCAVPVLIVSLIIALKSLWSNVRFACNEVQRRSLYIQVYSKQQETRESRLHGKCILATKHIYHQTGVSFERNGHRITHKLPVTSPV